MVNSGRYFFFATLILVSLLIFGVSIFVPMHSDDYFYFNLGLSLTEHLNHYMNWSGRILADYISSIILTLFSTNIVNILNGIVIVALIFFVVQIPYAVSSKKFSFVLDRHSAFSFLLIFCLYWVANPQLGHTSFWIVGAANYLWVALIAVIYFYFSIKTMSYIEKPNALTVATISFLAFLSGVSNESLAVAVVFISFVMFLVVKKNKVTYFSYVIWAVMGFCVLILSPGQSKRANIDAFSDWYSLTFVERVYEHFCNRVPTILGGFWILLVSIVIVGLVSSASINNNANEKKYCQIKFSMIFFVASLVSIGALVGAPYIPMRSTNGAFILMLCALSFLLAITHDLSVEKKSVIYIIISVITVYFSVSYYLMLSAIVSINRQNDIREKIIESKSNDITIPGFYMTKLMRDSDSIDYLHHSAASMQKFYNKKNIASVEVHFDYSQLRDELNALNSSQINKTDEMIIGIWPYKEGFSNNKIVVGFDCAQIKDSKDNGLAVFTHVYYNIVDGKYTGFLNVDPQGDISHFGGGCYKLYTHKKDFNISKIGKVEYGLYSPLTGIREKSESIVLTR